MSKQKLSINLLKTGVTESEALKYPNTHYLTLFNGQRLYYKVNPATLAKWVSFFENGMDVYEQERFKNKTTSGVIFYNVPITNNESRIFAVCFGYGKNLLNASTLERRFGLLVALNSIKPDMFRSIDKNSLGTNPLNSRSQVSMLTGLSNFDIDIDRDLIKAITGKTVRDENGNLIDGTLSGADSLVLATERKYNEIEEILKLCYQRYVSDIYKQNFGWIDRIQGVSDQNILGVLNDNLLNCLNSDNNGVWISIPEVIDFQGGFFFRLKSTEQYDDLDIGILKSEYNIPFTMSTIKSRRIACCSENGSVIKNWPVYNCLYYEVAERGKQYILNDGRWYRVEPSFVDEVNRAYDNAEVPHELNLFEYKEGEYEGQYNERVCRDNPERFFLMDKKNIQYGGNPIEFCDIYTANRQFVHVKKYHGSAVLSHLFAQGLVSAESFFDKRYRHLANEKLSDSFKVDESNDIQPGHYEIVYAIAKDDVTNGCKPTLPFFSKVAFRIARNRLEKFGYKVSVVGIGKEKNSR